MRTYIYPERKDWQKLTKRPELKRSALDSVVAGIIEEVRVKGDTALKKFSREFDGITVGDFRVPESEIKASARKVGPELRKAIQLAASNIRKFHSSQVRKEKLVETVKGVRCWRKNIAIDKAGLYIPGGTAPLFSTVLMLAIPANVAGCKQVILCTPPAKDGKVDPVLLYAAQVSGVKDVFRVGGAQAIAAMAYGTASIPMVDKIFGPGNQYVTRAKQLVQLTGTAIDMPAGPSEVLIVANEKSRPDFIAADLLSQAEHGIDSQVVLVTDYEPLIEEVQNEIREQLKQLPRKSIAKESLAGSFSVLLRSAEDCIDFSNMYAPEHLIIASPGASELAEYVRNAGSVFIGQYSCESAGDYVSGTNHTLPTNGFSKSYSGVSTESFLKKITFQEITGPGLKRIGKAIELMAEAEQLRAHRNAVTIRLNNI
ncbi:MAG TPA: histidinol dehydrogenase [Bacteroidales bacterium]|nr:histidinol dehydrogenase [Bacteroidales bacterium]